MLDVSLEKKGRREGYGMDRITLDENAWETLAGVAGPVEVCDPKGRVRGRYIPETEEEKLVREARQLFDLEEAKRRSAAGGFLTTEEVARRMREVISQAEHDRGEGHERSDVG